MNRQTTADKTANSRRNWALVALTAVLASVAAHGGIPEPVMVMYGQVRDAEGTQVFSGTLTWTFTPDGGTPVTVSGPIGRIDGVGGPFSYAIKIPFETGVQDSPVSTTALPLPDAPVQYTRQAKVNGMIVMTHSVSLSRSDRGTVKRVDVCPVCPAMGSGYHTADTNQDFSFSLSELLRTIELFTASSEHEYHCDAQSEDGYGLGLGSRSCAFHSCDYTNVPDWSLSLPELLRMIDLFTSSPEHAYWPDPTSEDGFAAVVSTKAARQVKAALAQKSLGVPVLAMTRTIRGGAPDAPAALDVTVSMDAVGGAPVTALGVQEQLPVGWAYDGIVSADGPDVAPPPGQPEKAEFAWVGCPTMPYEFTYRLVAPSGADIARQVNALAGEGMYRVLGGEGVNRVAMPCRVENGDAFDSDNDGLADDLDGDGYPDDLDGDGIPDAVEGMQDADGDGVPSFIDADSNNDGVEDGDSELDTPLAFVHQPDEAGARIGVALRDPVVLEVVVAGGQPPYSYEWIREDGQGNRASVGSDVAQLRIVAFAPRNEGAYTCVVSDGQSVISSNPVTLVLNEGGGGSAETGMPIAGLAALTLTALACAAGGVLAMRRKRT